MNYPETVISNVAREPLFVVPNRSDRRSRVTAGRYRMSGSACVVAGNHWANGLWCRRAEAREASRVAAIRDRWDSRPREKTVTVYE